MNQGGAAYSPPCITARRGGCVIKKISRSTEADAAGVVFHLFSFGKPPRPRYQRMLRGILLIARPPLLAVMQGGECARFQLIHSFIDRPSRGSINARDLFPVQSQGNGEATMRAVKLCTSVLAGFLAINTLSAQQQTALPSEVDEGRQLFLDNCAGCHGPDGDSVPGVDLGHGKFKKASSYDNVIESLRDGVPGTAMPAFSRYLDDLEMRTIVAYLRYIAATAYNTSAP